MIEDLIDEISSYRDVVNSTPKSFWSEVEGAAEYNASIEKRQKRIPISMVTVHVRVLVLKRHVECGNGGM